MGVGDGRGRGHVPFPLQKKKIGENIFRAIIM